jgi:peptidoglycan/LPS O-acetylase OafA/YrhL
MTAKDSALRKLYVQPHSAHEEPRIACLDGWRAVAIGLVIASHSYTMLGNSNSGIGNAVASVVSHAGYGVDIFFGISGFLICTLLLQEKKSTARSV